MKGTTGLAIDGIDTHANAATITWSGDASNTLDVENPISKQSMKKQNRIFARLLGSLAVACCVGSLPAADDSYQSDVDYALRPDPAKAKDMGHIGPTGILAHVEVGVKVTVDGTRKGSPAEGKFNAGEVILAVNGKTLEGADPFVVLGSEITHAEAADGLMVFDVASKEGQRKVSLQIPALGAYGDRWPVDCPKSKKIIERATAFYQKSLGGDLGLGIPGALPCLFLLSTGDDSFLPLIKKHYQRFIDAPDKIGDHTWNNGYNGIVCAEYFLRTGDKDMLPVLQAFCDDARDRQNYNSAWKHWGSDINPGYVGGGLMNPASTQVLTTLLLCKEAGVNVDEKTLTNALRFFYRFVGHGSVAYGDHRGEGGIGSNGKDGMLAAAMQVASGATGDTSAYQSARDSLSMATLDSYPLMIMGHADNGRGDGMWRGIASSYLMEKKPERYREVMDRIAWLYDLSRFDDGALGLASCQSFNDSGSGAAAAITYTAPMKHLRILGAKPSKYAKEFKLPETIWGNEADRAFLSIEPVAGHEIFAEPMPMHRVLEVVGNAYSKGKIETEPASVSTEALQGLVHHPNYVVRAQAAKGLRIKGEFETLEALLGAPDPRLRRAALDGIIDWNFWGGPGKKPLAAESFTPGMVKAITAMLTDPKESWYVMEGALFAVGFMPADVIQKNFAAIQPWTAHDDWWFRHASFMAMQGLSGEPKAYLKVVPLLTEMMVREDHTMPRANMNRALADSLKKYKPDTAIGRLIVKGFDQGVSESQVLEGNRSREGKYNVIETIKSSMKVAPDTAPQLAALLVDRGLSMLDDDELLGLVSGGKGADGLLSIAEKLKGSARKNLEDILYKGFRPEIAKRLKASGGKDIGKLDALLGIMGLGDAQAGWQIIGTPPHEERTWQYITFDPVAKKDIMPKREGRRFREIDLAPELKGWFEPGFNPSGWQSGKAPIGKGTHPRESKTSLENRSAWGDGEFLLARMNFELKDDPDFDLYRLRILCIQGFQVYLNGKKIQQYGWWQDPNEIRIWPMAKNHAALLKKGTNTLAVYTMEVYPSSQKPHWKGDVFAKFDCYIEGLHTADLY